MLQSLQSEVDGNEHRSGRQLSVKHVWSVQQSDVTAGAGDSALSAAGPAWGCWTCEWGLQLLARSAVDVSPGGGLALSGPMVAPLLEMSRADVCSLPNTAWRKQLQSSVAVNSASAQGSCELHECNDSEEFFGMLVSALVMFLKCWLSNQRGTGHIMQPWCIFHPISVTESLIFFFLHSIYWKRCFIKCSKVHTFIDMVEFSRKVYVPQIWEPAL